MFPTPIFSRAKVHWMKLFFVSDVGSAGTPALSPIWFPAGWTEVEFRLAGRGEEEEGCRRLASELKCRNAHFLGHVRQEELGREMRNADVFLFPSELEGHP